MNYQFTPRSQLSAFEWDYKKEGWTRPELDREVLNRLTQRSTPKGLFRLCLLLVCLAASAAAAIYISKYSLFLAIPVVYLYYFFFGFIVALGHELQHKILFGRSFDGFSEVIFFILQVLMWNSPRYARVSHRLHHRYTMVRGMDPETDWPEVITSKWLRKFLLNLVLRFFIVGGVIELFRWMVVNIRRALGLKDRMMENHCSEKDIKAIRLESLAILLIHLGVIAAAVIFLRWELIIFITLAWHIGISMESIWHMTEHIGRLYNVKDQRLCTRSIRVGPFTLLIYGGLDDHVDHHLFPAVPSYNLPELHKILKDSLAEPKNVIKCWTEMFAIAKEKDSHPHHEYVPVDQDILAHGGKTLLNFK